MNAEEPATSRSRSVSVRVLQWLRAHPIVTAGGVIVGAVVIWLIFFVFAFHLLFIDDKVNEADPFDAAAAEDVGSATSVSAGGNSAQQPTTARRTHQGSFIDRSHPASGTALVLTDGKSTFLRFENFETDNGPDLYVYLSANVTAASPAGQLDDDFVELGRLKGNIGSQNYEIPTGVDLGKYKTVVIWCRRFTTAFATSDIEAIR
jgi:hypothetical protein